MNKAIGALWKSKKPASNGKIYLSGNLEFIPGIVTKILVFQNDKKEKPNQPDYKIVVAGKAEEKKEDVAEQSTEF